jgi:predicted XRE-type DNA-binding protein
MTTQEKIKLVLPLYNNTEFRALEDSREPFFDTEDERIYYKIDIRERIKIRLEEENIPQRQFAIALGYTPTNFNNFMNGKRNIPFHIVEKILYLIA